MEVKSNEQFMHELDEEDMKIAGMDEYSLPAGHVLNIAFFEESDLENGQGYAWAESPESWELKPYEPSEPTAALKRETEEELRAAEAELKTFVEKCEEGAVHRSDKEKAKKDKEAEDDLAKVKRLTK